MAWVLVSLGITKIRLTGGEPLLRRGVVDFVRELSKLRSIDAEPLDIAITTNGHLLADIPTVSLVSRVCRAVLIMCWLACARLATPGYGR
jgi:MoaA/NifB/PqqE/SkfB family radical SAM enzyme